MSELLLKKISKKIIDHAEEAVVPERKLPKIVDDFFIQQLKEDELLHAETDSKLYEGLRALVKAEVLPLYEQYRAETARIRERKQKRRLWQYILGTVVVLEVLAAILSRGRSILPPVLTSTVILNSLIGALIYISAQYLDDRALARARKRLEKSIEGLDLKVRTDVDYDNRRQLLDAEVMRAEALEILAHYEKPEDFWRDYVKVREADPTVPAELAKLGVPAFERFLKFHVESGYSRAARQQRFDRLFIEAHELFISRDREHYVVEHLRNSGR